MTGSFSVKLQTRDKFENQNGVVKFLKT